MTATYDLSCGRNTPAATRIAYWSDVHSVANSLDTGGSTWSNQHQHALRALPLAVVLLLAVVGVARRIARMVRVVSLNDAMLKHVVAQYGVSKGEIEQPDGIPADVGRPKNTARGRRKTRKKPYGGKVWTDEEEKAWRKGEWEPEGLDVDLKGECDE